MLNSSVISLPFCFLCLIIIISLSTSCVNTNSTDNLNTTCQQCANMSKIISYDFCLTSLQPVPITHATNLQGLAIIAMALSIENASSTILSIPGMISSGDFDDFVVDCLTDCLELYADATSMVVDSIVAFILGYYDAAALMMNEVMEAVATCQEGFTNKEGEAAPLTTDNYNLFELSATSLCIINLL